MIIGIVSVVVLIILIKILSEKNVQSKSSSNAKKKSAGSTEWPLLGNYDFEVVGESNYQKALKKLAGDHGSENARLACTAEIIPEDGNPYDSKAVAIKIENQLVGYLAKEEARMFRRRLGQKGLSGITTTCAAMIVGGGTRKNGEILFYGVKLDLKPFD